MPHDGVVLELAAGLDARPRLRGDLLAPLLRNLRIEHQDELVFAALMGGEDYSGGFPAESDGEGESGRQGAPSQPPGLYGA